MLDAEKMTSILMEIEAQIDSRPRSYIGAEPNDLKALTPKNTQAIQNFRNIFKN
jgi:hypothetical protein